MAALEVEHAIRGINKKKKKNIIIIKKQTAKILTNICKIPSYNSVIYVYFCIGCIDFMLRSKSNIQII